MEKYIVRRIVLLSILIFAVSHSFRAISQTPTPQNELNFYQIQKQFYENWSVSDMESQKGWKQFKRWEWYWAPRVYPTGQFPNPMETYKSRQDEVITSYRGNNRSVGDWKPLGPNVTSGTGIGRINFVCFHPTDSNIIFIGAPSGGLWKSTNGGVSWTTNTDSMSVIGFSSMVINPQNPLEMYLASSDGDAYDTYSLGVLKSTDGGNTWTVTGLNFDVVMARTIRKLIMDPLHPDTIFAATNIGIYKTINGGVTWTRKTTFGTMDIEFKPGNTNVIYASSFSSSYSANGKFYRSLDGGNTFNEITGPFTGNSNRLAIGVTPADSNIVYVLASDVASANRNGFQGFYRMFAGVDTFVTMATSPNLLGWAVSGGDSKGQGWYDLEIAVSPTDKNMVFTGGVNVYKTLNGGSSWTLNAHWYGGGGKPWVHADVHAMEFQPGKPNSLWIGCDGGIFKTTNNGATYSDLSQSLVISQIYKIGVSTLDPDIILMGLQDNGTKLYNASTYDNVLGGDGMECLVDYSDKNIMYGSLYYGNIQRSTNGGANFSQIAGKNVKGIDEDGPWVTPFTLNPKDPKILYAGFVNIWKNYNRGYDNWIKISNFGGNKFVDIEVAPTDTSVIYAAKDNMLYKTIDGGANWTVISSGLPTSSASISDVEVSPQNSSLIWVTFSGYSTANKVFLSGNGGDNWVNFTGNLPNLPVNCITYQNNSNYGLYVGTDDGVFYRDSSMNYWIRYSTGLPHVIVNELEIYYGATQAAGRIRAATYGRGLWESELYYTPNTPPIAAFVTNDTLVCAGYSIRYQNNSIYSTGYKWYFPGGNPATSTERNPFIQYEKSGYYNVSLVVSNSFGKDSITKTAYIHVDSTRACIYTMNPTSSGDIYTSCSGKVFDPGGISVYPSSMNTYVTIAPKNATTLVLNFVSFDTEKDFDFLYIYDGTSMSSNLVGVFSGNSLPNGGIIVCSSGAATLKFTSDQGNSRQGFEIDWQCLNASMPPYAMFSVSTKSSCTGKIEFTDLSINNPAQWTWDFGDGTTSVDRNPVHYYTKNGFFNAKLIVSNANGSYESLPVGIDISIPDPPDVISKSRCGSGTIDLEAYGSENIYWYNDQNSQIPVYQGMIFTTPVINSTDTFYVQRHTPGPSNNVGAADNNIGNGGYYTGSQALIFDVFKPLRIVSTVVYALSTSDNKRYIRLKNAADSILYDTVIYVPGGENTVYLNFDVPVGNGFKLEASNSNLYRNNSGVSYPYTINNLVSIINSTGGTFLYYFFYNWEVKELDVCQSTKVPVFAVVNNIAPLALYNFTDTNRTVYFTNNSLDAFLTFWDFGDGTTDTAINPVHTFPYSGSYEVKLLVFNGCGVDSLTKTVIINSSLPDPGTQPGFEIYPNPNNGSFVFEYFGKDLIVISVSDLSGRNILPATNILGGNGKYKVQLPENSKGIYFLKVTSEKGITIKKLIVE